MDVYLKEKTEYQWIADEHIKFKGYFFLDEEFYSGSNAINCLRAQKNDTDMKSLLVRMNGSFCFVLENENQTICAVDRLRSLPLFYTRNDGNMQIGDDVDALVKNMPVRNILEISEKEFISTSLFVTGNKTLLEGLYQVEAGTFCVFDKETSKISTVQYFQMEHGDFVNDFNELEKSFWQAYGMVAKHLVRALNGRTAVIPLSGGADSRMVLTMLKLEEYKNVICYTYGRENNTEAEISRQVAEEFGYPWIFVPYTKKMWKEARKSKELLDYKEYAFAFTSTPHLQDFLAVKYLTEKNMIPQDGVFVPGHSGDLIAGSHITKEYLKSDLSRDAFLQSVYSKFFTSHIDSEIKESIAKRFPLCEDGETEKMASWIEWFNIQERQAKFIVNSVRAYEFFGHEWLIPLWDNCLFEFWKHVPMEWRYQRKLYFTIVKSQIPSTNDASIKKEVANVMRGIPGLRVLCRKVKKTLNWWKSPLMIERAFGFCAYIKSCFGENQFFTINTALNRQMTEYCKEKIRVYEEE